jgi:hypothetical protein
VLGTPLDGTATRWHDRHVFVRFVDERSRLGFGWVEPGDVRRRQGTSQRRRLASVLRGWVVCLNWSHGVDDSRSVTKNDAPRSHGIEDG